MVRSGAARSFDCQFLLLCRFALWRGWHPVGVLLRIWMLVESAFLWNHVMRPNIKLADTAVGARRSAVPPAFHFRLRQTSAGQVGATGAVHVASRRWLSFLR